MSIKSWESTVTGRIKHSGLDAKTAMMFTRLLKAKLRQTRKTVRSVDSVERIGWLMLSLSSNYLTPRQAAVDGPTRSAVSRKER